MRKPAGIVLVLSIAALALHGSIARYAHPAADDFCYAAKARGLSAIAWSIGEYHDWNGRYASNLLMWRNPLTWSADFLPGYRMVPLLLLALSALAYRGLVRTLTDRTLRPWQEWCGGLTLLALFLNDMPAIGEGVYWYTGAVTYQLANILCTLLVASLIRFERGAYFGPKPLHWTLNALLLAIIAGMDEQHLVLACAALLTWCLVRWRRGGRAPWALLLVAVAAAAVVLSTPGNAVRGSYFTGTHRLLPSLGMTVLQTARFLGTWLLAPTLLAASVLYVQLHLHLRERVPLFARSFGIGPLAALMLIAGVVALCVFPAYWAMGMLAQHRTLNVAYWIILPLWCMALSSFLEHPRLRGRIPVMPHTQLRIAVALLSIALFWTGNGGAAVADLYTGRAARYDAAMQARYRAFASPGPVVLQPLADPPRTLAPFEERRPDQHWMSRCTARYFGGNEDRIRMEGVQP
ncbi:MAG: DUF6056 family protein [Flavobacteriales bacterium]